MARELRPEQIKALQELARRGEGGERENARSTLRKLGKGWELEPEQPKQKPPTPNYQSGGRAYGNSQAAADFWNIFKKENPESNDDFLKRQGFDRSKMNSDAVEKEPEGTYIFKDIENNFCAEILAILARRLFHIDGKLRYDAQTKNARIPNLLNRNAKTLEATYWRNMGNIYQAALNTIMTTPLI